VIDELDDQSSRKTHFSMDKYASKLASLQKVFLEDRQTQP